MPTFDQADWVIIFAIRQKLLQIMIDKISSLESRLLFPFSSSSREFCVANDRVECELTFSGNEQSYHQNPRHSTSSFRIGSQANENSIKFAVRPNFAALSYFIIRVFFY